MHGAACATGTCSRVETGAVGGSDPGGVEQVLDRERSARRAAPVRACSRLDPGDERVEGVVGSRHEPRRTRSRPSRRRPRAAAPRRASRPGRASPKTSWRTGLISGRSSTSVRKTVTFTTSSKPQPAAASTARMFSNTCRVCATTSSPPTSRPSPSTATIPDTCRKPPARTASVKCEIGSANPVDADLLATHAPPRSSLSCDARADPLGIDDQLEHGGLAGGERPLERSLELLRPLDPLAVRAIRPRERGEVRVLEVGADHAARELPLLVHADRRVHAVVHEEDDDRAARTARPSRARASSSRSRRRP